MDEAASILTAERMGDFRGPEQSYHEAFLAQRQEAARSVGRSLRRIMEELELEHIQGRRLGLFVVHVALGICALASPQAQSLGPAMAGKLDIYDPDLERGGTGPPNQ